MAKIDILLPYWGEFGLLRKTVESVMVQTEEDWRLLVIDDCYPSNEAADYFSTIKDPRISYYRHKKNIGITNNFNYALNAAEAPYCVILGCDDVLLKNYLQRALETIGEADFYQPGVEVIDENGVQYLPLTDKIKRLLRPKRQGIHMGERLASSLSMGNWLYFPSIVWQTSSIKQYSFDNKHDDTQDVILELGFIRDGKTLYLDNEVTFQYRRSVNSWSSTRKMKEGGRFSDERATYTRFSKEFDEMGWHTAAFVARLHITSRLHGVLTRVKSKK